MTTDGCRRTEGRLSTTLAVKGCMLSTQQERSFIWIDPSDDKERNGGQAGESMVANLGISNPGLQMLGSNECDVSYQYGNRALFHYFRRIPPLYILSPKKNLWQRESCQPSSQYEWSVDGWMCCQITTPGRSK